MDNIVESLLLSFEVRRDIDFARPVPRRGKRRIVRPGFVNVVKVIFSHLCHCLYIHAQCLDTTVIEQLRGFSLRRCDDLNERTTGKH